VTSFAYQLWLRALIGDHGTTSLDPVATCEVLIR